MLLTADQHTTTTANTTTSTSAGSSTGRRFESIKLNSDHTKLIFRGPSPNSNPTSTDTDTDPTATTTTSTASITKGATKKGAKKRGQGGVGAVDAGDMSEAYCYIVWGGDEGAGGSGDGSSGGDKGSHHAVVQSDDESFRQVVLQALQANI